MPEGEPGEELLENYDVIIIGAGPAGLSAAIYAARGNQDTLVLGVPGRGAIAKVEVLDNYLGFPEGITGEELMELAGRQARRFGAHLLQEEALVIKQGPGGEGYTVETPNHAFNTKGIIIATGIKHERPKIEALEEYEGRGVSYCVVCDGFFHRDKKVGVIGSRDYAAKEALELLSYTRDVTIFTNGEELELQEGLRRQVEEEGIKVNTEKCKSVYGTETGTVGGLEMENGDKIELSGIFVAVGTSGAVDFAKTLGIQVEGTTIKVDRRMSTGVPRVYAAGDCTGGTARLQPRWVRERMPP
ncbi:MAG: NAD(P)/FAD-dependent oxidoreductase [Euryarchaeota archaeon]|nr:NAD(P)/FAD-dependent oxidoreductase [Euryarchaeota archaeon]